LILAIPNIRFSRGEPKMDDRLTVDVFIITLSIWKRMMHIVFVTPPSAAETIYESNCGTCEVIAYGPSTVAIVMADPSCLLHR